MKRTVKIIALLLIFCIIYLSLISCKVIDIGGDPNDYPGALYTTEDGSIWLRVYDKYDSKVIEFEGSRYYSQAEGEATKDGKTYQIFAAFAVHESFAFLATKDSDAEEKMCISAKMYVTSRSSFVLTVEKPYTDVELLLYEPGTKLVFNRVEE